ncbi:MAG: ABC transporter ATP-binding protein [Actinobacteria bacterium]|nr:ABC transporter ATP-binding protein [Actinomycetota bacterium]
MEAQQQTAHQAAITFADVSLGYGRRVVLNGVTLEVDGGELVGVIGPNGAGKSTLLRAIFGESDVLTGDVRILGKPIPEMSYRDRARIVGVLPQLPVTNLSFTAEEFVAMGRHPNLGLVQRLSEHDEAIVSSVMDRTDTRRLAKERVDTLSGGDIQRLTLAQALAQEPSVLLLDEPVSQLDLNHALQVLDLVRGLADGGMAVLAIFHDLDLAARYCDRLAVVHDGGLHTTGAPSEVLTAALVREVFGVRAVIVPDALMGSVTVVPVTREMNGLKSRGHRIFVVGGSGAAAPLMRQLVLAGYEVVAAPLNQGDFDQAVAEALGIEHVLLEPFGEVTSDVEAKARDMAAQSDVVLIAEVPFGIGNLGNLRAAIEAKAPIVFVNGFDSSRDYCDGAAIALASAAMRSGAKSAAFTDVLAAVEQIVD